jgi:hypothetical protein
MECLVCGEKYHTTRKAGADGKFYPENWECVNKCRLIHPDEKPAQKASASSRNRLLDADSLPEPRMLCKKIFA